MKMWMVAHEGYALRPLNSAGWSIIESSGEGGVYVKAVHMFTKKKWAEEWVERANFPHPEFFEIVTLEIHATKRRTKDGRRRG